MKKLLALLLTLIMAVSVVSIVPTANAETVVYSSNYCNYTLDKKGYATVIDFYNYKGICKKYGSYWKIPSKLKGHTVKKIILDMDHEYPENGFPFKKVRIPKTVTYIKNLAKYIRYRGYDSEAQANTGDYNSLIVCDEGSRAESYAKQCGLDYSIKGNIYGDMAYLGTYGFRYKYDKKYKTTAYGQYYMMFNTKERKLKFTISRGKQVLKLNRDYTVKYINNINPGKAYAIIMGKGKFYGVNVKEYDIQPSKPSVAIKQYTDVVNISHKEIPYYGNVIKVITQCSETPDFKEYKTFDNGTYSSDFKKGKTYYFRCRAQTNGIGYRGLGVFVWYRERNMKYSDIAFDDSYNYWQYSPWSDVKAVKIKYDYSKNK